MFEQCWSMRVDVWGKLADFDTQFANIGNCLSTFAQGWSNLARHRPKSPCSGRTWPDVAQICFYFPKTQRLASQYCELPSKTTKNMQARQQLEKHMAALCHARRGSTTGPPTIGQRRKRAKRRRPVNLRTRTRRQQTKAINARRRIRWRDAPLAQARAWPKPNNQEHKQEQQKR